MSIKHKTIIGVMGPGDDASRLDIQMAYKLGRMIADEGWVLLSGGRNKGVMDATSRGAKDAGGLTIGILPSDDYSMVSKGVDISIMTGMGDARNSINVLSSDVVVVCGMNPGTASEVALAIKAKKPIILINNDDIAIQFFKKLSENAIYVSKTHNQVRNSIKSILATDIL